MRRIDDQLAQFDRAKAWLIDRRMTLLAELGRQPAAAPALPEPRPAVEPRPELSGRAVARFLLVAGAVLVVIAAAVFTVASWSTIGALGRSAILLGVTAIVLVTPRLLTRRDLTATAEAIASIGLALTLADAYLAGRLLPSSHLTTAAACAALAGAWAGYGRATKLRAPVFAAIGLGQAPVFFATATWTRALGAFALAAVIMAGADLLLARTLARRDLRPEALTASVLAVTAWTVGVGLMLPVAAQALSGTSAEAAEALLAVITLGLAALVGLASPSLTKIDRELARAIALGLGVLAIGSMPAAVGASGWARVGILDAGATALLVLAAAQASGPRPAERRFQPGFVVTAGLGAVILAISAAATSPSVTGLAVLALLFGLAAAFARNSPAIVISTGAALAAATGLAFAAYHVAFAALGVAVIAIVGATVLRRKRPVHALVLDLGAGFVVIIAAIVAAPQKDTFAAVTAVSATLAGSTAWVRGGARRTIALVGAGCAALAAVGVQSQALGHAWFGNHQAWDGHPLIGTAGPGLPFATAVLALSLAAIVTAAGAWRGVPGGRPPGLAPRGERRGSLDALAIVLPVIAVPAALAGGLAYPIVLAGLLALALGLTIHAAIDGSLAPVSAAIAATTVALAWALATPAATLLTLGGLATCYLVLAWRSQARIATAALAVFSTAALTGAAALAVGQPAWLAGLSTLGVATIALVIAARLTAQLPLTAISVELAAWITTAIGTALCAPASLAFAIVGLQCLGTSLRADRRAAFWIGLVALEISWCLLLTTVGVTIIEAYTVPAAAIAIAARSSRS
ncbi:MAG TPA: hypothetical protein VFI65_34210, partial [Streptosporangiaceae bacterium]|nr:hypothetical protein [Streptosporangiaceae bacterium]